MRKPSKASTEGRKCQSAKSRLHCEHLQLSTGPYIISYFLHWKYHTCTIITYSWLQTALNRRYSEYNYVSAVCLLLIVAYIPHTRLVVNICSVLKYASYGHRGRITNLWNILVILLSFCTSIDHNFCFIKKRHHCASKQREEKSNEKKNEFLFP